VLMVLVLFQKVLMYSVGGGSADVGGGVWVLGVHPGVGGADVSDRINRLVKVHPGIGGADVSDRINRLVKVHPGIGGADVGDHMDRW